MSHTPGPWFCLTGGYVSTRVGPTWASNIIADVKSDDDLRVIAAAPELLDSLIELVKAADERFDPADPYRAILERARDSITRATGK